LIRLAANHSVALLKGRCLK